MRWRRSKPRQNRPSTPGSSRRHPSWTWFKLTWANACPACPGKSIERTATKSTGPWDVRESGGPLRSSKSDCARLAVLNCFRNWNGCRTPWAMAPATTSCLTTHWKSRATSRSRRPTAGTDRCSSSAQTNWSLRPSTRTLSYLYRIFQFDQAPKLYMLHGRVANRLHLEPIDYRASFQRLRA